MSIVSLLFCLLAADPTQLLVESIYPKSQRLKETRMPDLVRYMDLKEGSQVADVGCSTGTFSVILSHLVGKSGKVWCEDIRPTGTEVKRRHLKNVVIHKGADDDPKLPAATLDAVLIVNAYHEMPKYDSMLRHIHESLKPGGRLVILDNTPVRTAKRPREKQTNNHVLNIDLAAAELTAAGFTIVTRDDAFIDNPDSESAHWLLVAR